MTKAEAQQAIRKIIVQLMADHDPKDANYISNLRVIHEVMEDDNEKLKSVLVDKFPGIYGHTVFTEDPTDVLTVLHLEEKANQDWARLEYKDQILN